MRKVTVCFLLLLCSVLAVGQQQPQWTTVASVVLFNQEQSIPYNTPIFTPTETGIYRLNLYFSGGGTIPGPDRFYLYMQGYDITGGQVYVQNYLSCQSLSLYSMPPTMVSLKPNIPLVVGLFDQRRRPSPCQYNLVITVEQLVQQ
jgi:hypothetical protein